MASKPANKLQMQEAVTGSKNPMGRDILPKVFHIAYIHSAFSEEALLQDSMSFLRHAGCLKISYGGESMFVSNDPDMAGHPGAQGRKCKVQPHELGACPVAYESLDAHEGT